MQFEPKCRLLQATSKRWPHLRELGQSNMYVFTWNLLDHRFYAWLLSLLFGWQTEGLNNACHIPIKTSPSEDLILAAHACIR